jgi:hypothetical protein
VAVGLCVTLAVAPGCATDPSAPTGGQALVVGQAPSIAIARAAFGAGDYASAAREVQPLAEAGDPEAQHALGYLLYYGQGVPQDRELAVVWLRRSAAQGNPRAQASLERLGYTVPPAPSASVRTPAIPAELAPEKETTAPPAPAARPEPTGPGAYRTQAEAAPAGAPRNEGRVGATAPRPSGPRDEAWVRAQHPDHYTVQVAAAPRETPIAALTRTPGLQGLAVYVDATRGGHPWFIALYGSYPSPTEAEAAIEALDPALLGNRPWVRSFRSVWQAMSGESEPGGG